jgi:hypothetical protein
VRGVKRRDVKTFLRESEKGEKYVHIELWNVAVNQKVRRRKN